MKPKRFENIFVKKYIFEGGYFDTTWRCSEGHVVDILRISVARTSSHYLIIKISFKNIYTSTQQSVFIYIIGPKRSKTLQFLFHVF